MPKIDTTKTRDLIHDGVTYVVYGPECALPGISRVLSKTEDGDRWVKRLSPEELEALEKAMEGSGLTR